MFAVSSAYALHAQQADTTVDRRLAAVEKTLDRFDGLTISGYIHAQWQWTRVAGPEPEGFVPTFGDPFSPEMNNRFTVRRGIIKLTYTQGLFSGVVTPNFTEKGFGIKDVYVDFATRDKVLSVCAGLFNRPFGYEIELSSSDRESAERSRIFTALFPGQRDVGAKVVLRGKSGFLSQLTLDAGLFSGNGVAPETDSYKDFIGRLAWNSDFQGGTTQVGLAASCYAGTVYGGTMADQTHNSYTYVRGSGWRLSVTDRRAARTYWGISGYVVQRWWPGGTTKLTAEYITGQQPSAAERFAGTMGSSFNGSTDLYLREFGGGYVMLVQNIGSTRFSGMLKYDFFDPNLKVGGNAIGGETVQGDFSASTAADIAYKTYSLGALFDLNDYVRFSAQYDIARNETTTHIAGFGPGERIHQNVLTLRVQIKF